jgi:tetratricopeptide (TPR) repeat protein
MTEIRAFVAHSFTKEDEAVVGSFLKYFDQLSRSAIAFSWQHAEPAEPKILAEKVKSTLSDKNVLIAICTKRECVIAPSALKNAFFSPDFFKAKRTDLSWKTSDWIIQEIGLAIGKGLDLILLIESDVQNPGGLQGDLEYITFDRSYPDRSFGKVLEMITALSPKASGLIARSSETRSPLSEVQKEPTPTDQWWVPKPEWDRSQYEATLMVMVPFDKTDHIPTLTQAYLDSKYAEQRDNKQRWEALVEYVLLLHGKGGSLAKLKALAEAHPHSPGTLEQLAKGFALFENHRDAATTYEQALHAITDGDDVFSLLARAAVQYMHAKDRTAADALISRMKSGATTIPNGELRLLRALREIAEIEKDEEATLAFMERIIQIEPDDDRTRFSLAFKYSEGGNDALALFHYLRTAADGRDPSTWNNLAVEFDRAGLFSKAVEGYKIAEEMGETLAMSNLAQKFISAGFLSEAKEQCDKALQLGDFHPNVAHTLAQLKELPGEENNRQAEIIERTRPKSEFYRQFGRAGSQLAPTHIPENWQGPLCFLRVTLNGTQFTAVGSYERHGLAGLLSALPGFGAPSPTARIRVEYVGTLRGRAIEGSVTEVREGETPPSLLSAAGNKTTVLMVLTNDDNELRVMEKSSSNPTRFYTINRKPTAI